MDEWMGEWMDGWMGGVDGSVDEWVNEWNRTHPGAFGIKDHQFVPIASVT